MAFLLSTFASSVAGLTISGVTSQQTSYPSQISTGMLPLSYPRLPSLEGDIVTIGQRRGLQKATVDLVIILEAVKQSRNPENWELATQMIDNVLESLSEAPTTIGIDSWAIVLDIEEYGQGKPFWELIVRVSGSGT